MDFLKNLLLLTGSVSIFFMFLGLYKPYWMVWWEDIQNRKKVVKVYGISALIFLLIYQVINFMY